MIYYQTAMTVADFIPPPDDAGPQQSPHRPLTHILHPGWWCHWRCAYPQITRSTREELLLLLLVAHSSIQHQQQLSSGAPRLDIY